MKMTFGGLDKLAIVLLASIIIYIVSKVLCVLYTYVFGPAIHKVDFKSKGKWALVTGSTDGIGKQYARELAARGCDIVLVSRTLDKLKSTAADIEKDYKVETKIIQADFTDDKIYEQIAKDIADLEIGTLVNNVGISYPYPEYFLDIPEWDTLMTSLFNANMVSVTRMTGLILPGMVKRGKGVIINIGSLSSSVPSPLLTVYAASKAYVDKFTEGLQMEYEKRGIIIQSVLPGFVCSNLSGIKRSSLLAPTAKTFVKSAISLVGTTAKTTGYVPHAFMMSMLNCLHKITGTFAIWLVTRSMENTRRRAMKKYKKQ